MPQQIKGKLTTDKKTGESNIVVNMPDYPTPTQFNFTPPPVPKFDYLKSKEVNAIVDQIRKVIDGVDITTASKAMDIVELDLASQVGPYMGPYTPRKV